MKQIPKHPSIETPNFGISVFRYSGISTLLPLLDHEALFVRRWQMLRPGASTKAREEAELTLKRLLARTRNMWQPQIVSGLFPARITAAGLSVRAGRRRAALRLSTSFRERLTRRRDLGEFPLGIQVVTVGGNVVDEAHRFAKAGSIYEQFLLHGLAAELTEALAVYSQQRVEMMAGWKNSRRYSPGYPVLPELADQRGIFRLLSPKRIGVRLTRSYQMVPEYSTSAIILPLPETLNPKL
jgi:cobalamin-dependent methionine synthase I